ncbi:hypothetical protein [Undibacterium sp.]|nr:hypothetical protein [Undibacterium sp.]HTD03405.1 hypothetical protein [Undibacterium sp.]
MFALDKMNDPIIRQEAQNLASAFPVSSRPVRGKLFVTSIKKDGRWQ